MSDWGRGRGQGDEPQPKPYEFVELPPAGPALAAPTGHHRYARGLYSGTLTARIIARSPVHVASGILEQTRDRSYPLVKGMFRTLGRAAIPATSLKGCIRSIVEAISASSVQITRARELPRNYQPSRKVDQLDVSQRIFGALGYQGMVRFSDAVLESGRLEIVPTPQLFRPRSEASQIYFPGGRPRGRKFYQHGALAGGDLPLEACEADSVFTLHTEFESLSRGQLGLLLTGMGLGEPRLWPKLGGGKPACLGTIEITAPAIHAFEAAGAYDSFDAAAQPLEIPALLQAARDDQLILDRQLRDLAHILRWPREDRECPEGTY